jgi:hypothetical protein
MKPTWAALFVCCAVVLASDVRAQVVAVRLEVDQNTWLPNTPIDLRAELTAKLKDAHIDVTDRADVPLVVFRYEEQQTRGYAPYLVPGTTIACKFEIDKGAGQRSYILMPSVTAKLLRPGQDFPDASELRSRSVEALKIDPMFSVAGHVVGAVLGLEPSFRALNEVPAARPTVHFLLFLGRVLPWTPENDDIFDRAIQQMAGIQTTGSIERFLFEHLLTFQQINGPTPMSVLSSMAILGEVGGRSAAELVRSIELIMKDPHTLDVCEETLDKIAARNRK